MLYIKLPLMEEMEDFVDLSTMRRSDLQAIQFGGARKTK